MKKKLVRLVLAGVLAMTAMSTNASAAACEEWAYDYCENYCWGVAQDGGCSFFANQLCLCMRAPADCPVCY